MWPGLKNDCYKSHMSHNSTITSMNYVAIGFAITSLNTTNEQLDRRSTECELAVI